MSPPPDGLAYVAEVAQLVASALAGLSGRAVSVRSVQRHRFVVPEVVQRMAAVDPTDPGTFVEITTEIDGVGYVQYVDERQSRCELARLLAGNLADEVHLTDWGRPFPPCPRHAQHPIQLAELAGGLHWVCPRQVSESLAVLIESC